LEERMTGFKLGDVVMIRGDINNVSRIVAVAAEETGRTIYEVEKEGYFYPHDLQLVSPPSQDISQSDGEIKSIVVTGGAGYVGSVLVKTLLQEGYRVICMDNLRFGGEALGCVWGHPRFSLIMEDVTNFDRVASILRNIKCEAIVHLAAIVGDPACKLEPELARRTNLEASVNLLENALGYGIPRFIFASTCSNYGKMGQADEFVDELSPLAPVSLYAELKVAFEEMLLKGIKKRETFTPTALRFATVYGMSPRMRFDLTVNEFTKELALGRELVVFGEQFWRPYCHVSDFSRAILSVIRAPRDKVAYAVFNVGGTHQNYTKKMIVDELLRHQRNTNCSENGYTNRS
jgi:nucleoside-diphosphate-sugar epimerase